MYRFHMVLSGCVLFAILISATKNMNSSYFLLSLPGESADAIIDMANNALQCLLNPSLITWPSIGASTFPLFQLCELARFIHIRPAFRH